MNADSPAPLGGDIRDDAVWEAINAYLEANPKVVSTPLEDKSLGEYECRLKDGRLLLGSAILAAFDGYNRLLLESAAFRNMLVDGFNRPDQN